MLNYTHIMSHTLFKTSDAWRCVFVSFMSSAGHTFEVIAKLLSSKEKTGTLFQSDVNSSRLISLFFSLLFMFFLLPVFFLCLLFLWYFEHALSSSITSHRHLSVLFAFPYIFIPTVHPSLLHTLTPFLPLSPLPLCSSLSLAFFISKHWQCQTKRVAQPC